ncbi:MAG: DUF4190 domain-containing protein [Fimbriimonadia bacterium]|nr:DUF4190 domain-containing protein [Fimbriimonadia bacterium]
MDNSSSNATTILVLGIVGLVTGCFPLGIAAWIMGNNSLAAIDRGEGDPSQRGTINAGRICGMVSIGLWACACIGYAAMFALAVATGSFSN